MHFEGRFKEDDKEDDEKGDGKEKLRGSPASEEFALLYIRDTTNLENFKTYIFLSKKGRDFSSLLYNLCFFLFEWIIIKRYE